MKRLMIVLILLAIVYSVSAQKDKKLLNWYNKDLKSDKIYGVSADKAYKSLLKGKTSTPVIVAIIDGGTDIKHEDLQGVIWTNTDEIEGNGIDDDNNGYIDDIHGWNFIGNADGRNVEDDNLEVTRLFRKLDAIYRDADVSMVADEPDYKLYVEVKKVFESKYDEAKEMYPRISEMAEEFRIADSVVRSNLGKDEYTQKDVEGINTSDEFTKSCISYVGGWLTMGVTYQDIADYENQVEGQFLYQYNVEYDPRSIVGDNYEDNSNHFYGNPDVAGPDPGHGTFVAGNVGAVRNNKIGADGIAGNVQLMIVRVVPGGDERDKDVANGIRYAIENGAKVINMSFGKAYSPQKQFVDDAVALANQYDVLLVHAAGNEALNNDVSPHFPNNLNASGKLITENWLEVGASAMKADENLAASFSNYGKKSVDVFAPGVDLNGLEPGNKYGNASGTSMASPVAAGVAAVIRSYYPQLTAKEVRDIIVQSAVKYDKQVNKPTEKENGSSISFSELSVSGGVVNLYNALKMAADWAKNK